MKQAAHNMTLFEWSLLFVLSLVWGGSFFFAAIAVQDIPPLSLACLRVAGAALVLHITLRILGLSFPLDLRIWRTFFVMGLMNNVIPFALIFWAQTGLASGVASILNAMTPIFTVIAAHFLTRDEPMTLPRFVGVALGFAGVFILMGGARDSGGGIHYIAMLGAAISYALASIYGKRFMQMGIAPLVTATGQVSASAVILLPVILLIDRPWTLPMPGVPVIFAVLALAILSTAFAYFLYFRILSTAGATNLALVTFLIPPSAIMLGVFILGEQLTHNHIAGMIVIGLGLVAIDGRCFGYFQKR